MRQANKDDLRWILAALAAWRDKSPAYHVQFANLEYAMENIERAMEAGLAYFFGGYFVLIDVGREWHSRANLLIEKIIIKVYPEDKSCSVDDVIAGLEQLKVMFKADCIVVGDTQIGYMTPKYQAAGFTMLGVQLMK